MTEKMRAPKRTRAGSVVIALVLAGALLAAAAWVIAPGPALLHGSGEIAIAEGDSFHAAADRLRQNGIVRSAAALDALARIAGGELQAGRYEFPRGATLVRVYLTLTSGRPTLERVTIPEGWTLLQIADLLEKDKVVSRGAFVAAATSPSLLRELAIPGDSAQGFLFPDTYFFPQDYPADRVVRTMVANFFANLGKIDPDHARLAPRTLWNRVILASIVEREYRVAAEAPEIASVFDNRLARGMRLQSCATVAFVLTDILGEPHRDRLFDRDLEVASPYNTYLHAGLPPAAISNPGRTALRAAFFPAKTNYLYFVLKDPTSGEHVFSADFAEHTIAKFQYLNLYLKNN